MQKTCTNCSEIKDVMEFYNESKSWCKECEKHKAKEKRRSMSEEEKRKKYEKEKRWREANPDKVMEYKMRHQPPVCVLPKVWISRREWIYLKQAQEIMEEYNNCCAYCGRHRDEVSALGFDHIKPYSKGGRATRDNLVPACRSCNSAKSATEDFPVEPKRP